MTTTIVVSEKALQQLLLLNVDRENFLRLWVEPGGCSGMIYQAAIDTEQAHTDNVLYQDENLRILTDVESLPHFDGVHIDYSDDLVASGFRFSNPNAVRTCGCGSSFQCGQ